jgi:putative copper resistance protein D
VFDAAVIVLRLVQMTGAMILFGSSLFFIYGLPRSGPVSAVQLPWPRALLAWSAALILGACVLGLIAQTAVLAGSLADALSAASLKAVLTGMSFGKSSIVRAVAAGAVLLMLILIQPGRAAWIAAAAAGTVICASFAWMGHGAATSGALGLVHTASDILHTLAAGLWIGALVAFLSLLIVRTSPDQALRQALHGFSGIGSGVVAVLVATGLINGGFVIGWAGIPSLWATHYGQLLCLKLILFLGMVCLAALNRFRLTPALGAALDSGRSATGALGALRASLFWETALSIGVLALVAWFGTLDPHAH